MRSVRPQYQVSVLVAVLSGLLAGCGNLGRRYSEIDPAGALEDVRKHNGYYALKELEPGTAKLVMRAQGAPFTAAFEVSRAVAPCEGFEKVGTATDLGRGVVYPWVANMTTALTFGRKPRGYLEIEVDPAQRIQLRANSFQHGREFSSCGPFAAAFVPAVNRAYLVEFTWHDSTCSMRVSDATDPQRPVPVATENLAACLAR